MGMTYGERGRKLRGKSVNHVVTSCNVTLKISPSIVTNCNVDGDKISSCIVQKLHPNNNNLDNNNIITTKKKMSLLILKN